MPGRPIKPLRYARPITVQGDEVYTRWSKREYESRREMFDNPADYGGELPYHLRGHDYDQ